MVPSSGCSMPARIFISVLLPEPLGPIRPVRSVSSKEIEIPLNRGRTPKALESNLQFRSNVMSEIVESGDKQRSHLARVRSLIVSNTARHASMPPESMAFSSGNLQFLQRDQA